MRGLLIFYHLSAFPFVVFLAPGLGASRAKFPDLTAPQKPIIFLILLFVNLLIYGLGASGARFINLATL